MRDVKGGIERLSFYFLLNSMLICYEERARQPRKGYEQNSLTPEECDVYRSEHDQNHAPFGGALAREQ